MIAQLVSSTAPSTSQDASALQAELAKLRQQCLRLNQALDAERAKTSKLRNFIGRFSNSRVQPTATTGSPTPTRVATSLESLVTDQNRLIEQLYSENEKNRASVAELTHRNQQLLTANDKLKTRNIDLRRQLKSPSGETKTKLVTSESAPATPTETIQSGIRTVVQGIKENMEHKRTETTSIQSQKKRAHQWLRASLA